jgi:aspartate carbamoyltransferase catalytic subunit
MISTRHLTGINDLDDNDIDVIIERAEYYSYRLPAGECEEEKLRGKIILTLFFENSTRTCASFDIAAKRLGARVIYWDAQRSSLQKGETFIDTVRTLGAMAPDAIVIRHPEHGAPIKVRDMVECPVINAGDAAREHPTQALLDCLTLRQHFGEINGLTISIVGDIAHSRVANSNMILLTRLGANVRLIAPRQLMPGKFPVENVEKYNSLEEGLTGADAVMTIRPQKERMESMLIDDREYFGSFGMNHERLNMAGREAVLLDPGPFLRNLQISDELADDRRRFLYDKQVANGVPTRMAVLDMLIDQ